MFSRTFVLSGLTLVALATSGAGSRASECTAESGPVHVPLLELYTSEGCSSCPPADRWLSGFQEAGLDLSSVVPIAFHVDYWDRLGWIDRFSNPAFSARQHVEARRQHRDFVFTPQFVLDGQDFRSGGGYLSIRRYVASVSPERAHLALKLSAGSGAMEIIASVRLTGVEPGHEPELFIAVTENRLASQVLSGENKGRRLNHDAVARVLIGPIAVPPENGMNVARKVEPGADWNRGNLSVVAFVQDRTTGDVLQALGLRSCR